MSPAFPVTNAAAAGSMAAEHGDRPICERCRRARSRGRTGAADRAGRYSAISIGCIRASLRGETPYLFARRRGGAERPHAFRAGVRGFRCGCGAMLPPAGLYRDLGLAAFERPVLLSPCPASRRRNPHSAAASRRRVKGPVRAEARRGLAIPAGERCFSELGKRGARRRAPEPLRLRANQILLSRSAPRSRPDRFRS
jgi:hypothetical protein